MNTVIWIISNHRIYVGDYYEENFKVIPFEKCDYWEVYGSDDIEKLVDYMNYPLNYRQFQDSYVVLLIDDWTTYECLSKVSSIFDKSLGVVIEGINQYGIEIDEEEDVNIKTLFNPIIEPIATLEQLVKEASKNCFQYQLVLSPAQLNYKKTEEKRKYLEVEDIIEESGIPKDGQYYQKGEALLTYTHYVQKLWGREERTVVEKKAPVGGQFYLLKPYDAAQSNWVIRHEPIGILAPQTASKTEVLEWYKKLLTFTEKRFMLLE